MKKILLLFSVFIQIIGFAQNLETATPKSVSLSSAQLKRIGATLNE